MFERNDFLATLISDIGNGEDDYYSAPSEGQTGSLVAGVVRSVSVDRDSGNYSLQTASDRLEPPDF